MLRSPIFFRISEEFFFKKEKRIVRNFPGFWQNFERILMCKDSNDSVARQSVHLSTLVGAVGDGVGAGVGRGEGRLSAPIDLRYAKTSYLSGFYCARWPLTGGGSNRTIPTYLFLPKFQKWLSAEFFWKFRRLYQNLTNLKFREIPRKIYQFMCEKWRISFKNCEI